MAKPLVNNINTNSERSIWKKDSEEGRYFRNQEILVDGFLTQANKDTFTYPAPQEVGDAVSLLPDLPPFATTANLSVVVSGVDLTLTEAGSIKSLEAWVPTVGENISYRVIVIDNTDPNNPETKQITGLTLQPNQWNTIVLSNAVFPVGTRLIVLLESINVGATTDFNGGWRYIGTSQSDNPPTNGWNRDNQDGILRIDKTDLDEVDRESELLGCIPGTTINIVETGNPSNYRNYIVNELPILDGNTIIYNVNLTDSGGSIGTNETSTLNFSVPVAASTDYVFANDYWLGNQPSFGTAEGFLSFNGVEQPTAVDDAFGINLTFQKYDISEDWDIKSYSPELSLAGESVDINAIQGEISNFKPILRAQSFDTFNLSSTPITLSYSDTLQSDWFVLDNGNTEIITLQDGLVHFDLDLNIIADNINESKIWIVYWENNGVSWDIIHTANQYYEANRRSSGYTAFTHVIEATKLYKYRIQVLMENNVNTSIESVSYNSGIGELTTPSINLTLIGIT